MKVINMNEKFGINNKVELYKRLVPALNSKVKELEKNGEKNIKKEDLWNYFIKNKWTNINSLSLSELVDDILNIDNNIIIQNISINK